MKTYRLSARIDEVTHRRLIERARLEVKDESEIIREALKRHLDERVDSAHDALMRTGGIGIATGLPSDLSTNKKYFEGFGGSDLTRSSRHRTTRRTSRS
jgi:hypothetical protein